MDSLQTTMKQLHEIYKDSFFKRRSNLAWRVPLVCDAICKVLPFISVVDIGCAIGDFVQGFNERGKRSFGIEGSKAVLPYLKTSTTSILITDLRYSIIPSIRNIFDLVLCLEVAEHIEPEYCYQFVQNITDLGDDVLISMAPPGQKGHYHVNCQDVEYWDNKFAVFGFARQDHIAEKIKKEWEPHRKKKGINAYYANLHFYKRINTCLM